MTTIDLGAPVKTVWTGAPAGGSYAVALTRPDGTVFTSPQIVQSPDVSATFVPDMSGRWTIRWTSTNPASAYTDVANVWPQQPNFLISVSEARQALGMKEGTNPDTLDELRLFIAAATPIIEDMTGPLIERQLTVEIPPSWSYTILPGYTPGTALTVTYKDTGLAVTATQYKTDDLQSGLLYLNPTTRAVLVTYTVGKRVIPFNVQLGARELVRHLWQVARQAGRVAFPGTQEDPGYTPSGFAVPKRVIELCAAGPGGFA